MRFPSEARPILTAVLLVFFLTLSACAKLPFSSPRPGDAVKGAMSAAAQGNLEEMMKYMPEAELAKAKAASKDSIFGSFGEAIGKGFTKVLMAAMQHEINSKGGITVIEIDREQITGDTATVNFTVRFGNGTARSDQTRCITENGVWKITAK